MVQLLARRRGIFWIIYLLFRGIGRGEPVSIAIAVGIVVLIIGITIYKRMSAQ